MQAQGEGLLGELVPSGPLREPELGHVVVHNMQVGLDLKDQLIALQGETWNALRSEARRQVVVRVRELRVGLYGLHVHVGGRLHLPQLLQGVGHIGRGFGDSRVRREHVLHQRHAVKVLPKLVARRPEEQPRLRAVAGHGHGPHQRATAGVVAPGVAGAGELHQLPRLAGRGGRDGRLLQGPLALLDLQQHVCGQGGPAL